MLLNHYTIVKAKGQPRVKVSLVGDSLSWKLESPQKSLTDRRSRVKHWHCETLKKEQLGTRGTKSPIQVGVCSQVDGVRNTYQVGPEKCLIYGFWWALNTS